LWENLTGFGLAPRTTVILSSAKSVFLKQNNKYNQYSRSGKSGYLSVVAI
jgi:hypothetical protein